MAGRKDIEDLGAPWLAMGEAAAPDRYSIPLDTSETTPPDMGEGAREPMFTLEGYGGSNDPQKRLDAYDWMIRFGHRRGF